MLREGEYFYLLFRTLFINFARPFGRHFKCLSLRRTMRNGIKLILLAMMVLFASAMAAQDITATIVGTVKDQSGAVVPKARVVVTNTDTGLVARTIATNDSGEYSAPQLAIGHYSVT